MAGVSERLDALIIGTGQAGKPLAGALAGAGRRTVIVERGRVGGTCIIDGCTPTKTMVASAAVAHLARRAREFGVHTGAVSVDMQAVRARKRTLVDSFSAGVERGLRKHETLELVFGAARFTGPHAVEVALRDGGTRRFEAPWIFIDVGSRPRIPDIPGLADVPWLDNASVMELDVVPEHLLVLGGGFVGLEFAQMFRRFGAQVTVVEQAPRLAAREDDDIAAALTEILEQEGIALRLGARVERVEREGDGIGALLAAGEGSTRVRGSHLLVAVGRTPNTDSLNLPAAGIRTDERGFIEVTERLETNVSGVYALGEANGSPAFTHVAYDDYRVVRAHLLDGSGAATTRRRQTPYVVFTDPQLGRVGLTERQAAEEGRAVRVARLPMSRVARASETGETKGLMKAVVDAGNGRILGAALLGRDGGEILAVLQTAMLGELPYTALRDAVFSHPTTAEALNNLFMTLD